MSPSSTPCSLSSARAEHLPAALLAVSCLQSGRASKELMYRRASFFSSAIPGYIYIYTYIYTHLCLISYFFIIYHDYISLYPLSLNSILYYSITAHIQYTYVWSPEAEAHGLQGAVHQGAFCPHSTPGEGSGSQGFEQNGGLGVFRVQGFRGLGS